MVLIFSIYENGKKVINKIFSGLLVLILNFYIKYLLIQEFNYYTDSIDIKTIL